MAFTPYEAYWGNIVLGTHALGEITTTLLMGVPAVHSDETENELKAMPAIVGLGDTVPGVQTLVAYPVMPLEFW